MYSVHALIHSVWSIFACMHTHALCVFEPINKLQFHYGMYVRIRVRTRAIITYNIIYTIYWELVVHDMPLRRYSGLNSALYQTVWQAFKVDFGIPIEDAAIFD